MPRYCCVFDTARYAIVPSNGDAIASRQALGTASPASNALNAANGPARRPIAEHAGTRHAARAATTTPPRTLASPPRRRATQRA